MQNPLDNFGQTVSGKCGKGNVVNVKFGKCVCVSNKRHFVFLNGYKENSLENKRCRIRENSKALERNNSHKIFKLKVSSKEDVNDDVDENDASDGDDEDGDDDDDDDDDDEDDDDRTQTDERQKFFAPKIFFRAGLQRPSDAPKKKIRTGLEPRPVRRTIAWFLHNY